jgi:hypothetical protein
MLMDVELFLALPQIHRTNGCVVISKIEKFNQRTVRFLHMVPGASTDNLTVGGTFFSPADFSIPTLHSHLYLSEPSLASGKLQESHTLLEFTH